MRAVSALAQPGTSIASRRDSRCLRRRLRLSVMDRTLFSAGLAPRHRRDHSIRDDPLGISAGFAGIAPYERTASAMTCVTAPTTAALRSTR